MKSIRTRTGKIPLVCCERAESLTDLPDSYFWNVERLPRTMQSDCHNLERCPNAVHSHCKRLHVRSIQLSGLVFSLALAVIASRSNL
jgi:hypothetical protein